MNLQTGAVEASFPLFQYTDANKAASTGVSLEYVSGSGMRVNDVTGNKGTINPNGNPVRVVNPNAINNGRLILFENVMDSRAITIKIMLMRLGIHPGRINIQGGSIYNDPSVRFVGVQVQ